MSFFVEEYRSGEVRAQHPSIIEPASILFGALQGLLGAIVGLELLTRVGITPNTSVIGAIIAIGVSRLPLAGFKKFRSMDRQNLMQTAISAATFGGANALLLPVGILWLMGNPELVPAMFLGAFLGMLIDAAVLYKVFDSRAYPACAPWPPGVATAECLLAGDRGGKRAFLLGAGAAAGGAGRLLGIPMDIIGVCWIGNVWALAMFALGLLIAGHSAPLFGFDVNRAYLPHGVMIGAGLVAVIQMAGIVRRKESQGDGLGNCTRTNAEFGKSLGVGLLAFMLAAAALAAAAGLYTAMPPGTLALFVVFSAVAALVSELIVGISAMHAGWFPAFATALIFLVLGMLMGFPPLALAFMVGFTASTGPAFADMGYDLKTGWIVRGNGQSREYEMAGRRQQFLAALLGFLIAAAVVFFTYERYFRQELLPPVDFVFVATIRAGASAHVARQLLLWAVPGALVQLIGGPTRQIGILLATGLLISNPLAGWTALAALGLRGALGKRFGKAAESPRYVLAGGFIAGSALASFGAASMKLR